MTWPVGNVLIVQLLDGRSADSVHLPRIPVFSLQFPRVICEYLRPRRPINLFNQPQHLSITLSVPFDWYRRRDFTWLWTFNLGIVALLICLEFFYGRFAVHMCAANTQHNSWQPAPFCASKRDNPIFTSIFAVCLTADYFRPSRSTCRLCD
jgi:hypothetical protein